MKKIGLLSDTHGYLDPAIEEFFSDCDEIWHAGDIGSEEICSIIMRKKPLRAVYGNIDGTDIRIKYPRHHRFHCEEVDVWITHKGGAPGKYKKSVYEVLKKDPPKLFISGHSHILKVIFDKKLNMLHINPGAAGKFGIHQKITAVRFIIDGQEIRDLEVFEKDGKL